jgi:hypothetical protein
MTAWTRRGRTAASPSRLARSAPPLRGCGLDRLSSARQGLSKRSWLKVSGVAPIAKASPLSVRSVPWGRHGPFRADRVCPILAECPGTALPCVTAPYSANFRTIFMSCPVPGRESGDQSNTTFKDGESWTIGPHACRSPKLSSTCSRHGSAICSMRYSGRADDLRRALP